MCGIECVKRPVHQIGEALVIEVGRGDARHPADEGASAVNAQELPHHAAHRRVGMPVSAAVGAVAALALQLIIGARLHRIDHAAHRRRRGARRHGGEARRGKAGHQHQGERPGDHLPPAPAWSRATSAGASVAPLWRNRATSPLSNGRNAGPVLAIRADMVEHGRHRAIIQPALRRHHPGIGVALPP
jgi:hypothetical protein